MGLIRRILSHHGPRRGYATGEVGISTGVNVRELGGFETPSGRTLDHRLLRSGTTSHISKADARTLWDYGVRSVLDLRGAEEVEADPERLCQLLDVDYENVPFFDYDLSAQELSAGDGAGGYLADGYFKMLANKDAVRRIFSFLGGAERGTCTLFHCGAGSDRTGILSMLLLGLAGVDRKAIIADYAYSFGYIPEVNAAIFETRDASHTIRPELAMRIEAISVVLDRLIERYGTFRCYLAACGVPEEEVEAVRQRLVGEHVIRGFTGESLSDRDASNDEKRDFYVRAYNNPDKMTVDLYYFAGRARDLTAKADQNQHDRSFHDHDYVVLDESDDERGKVFAPVAGEVVTIAQDINCNCAEDGIYGVGIAIVPQGNMVFAPATCRVTAQLPSRNALGLLTQDGVEMLLAVGSSVERYRGSGFRQHAWQNDTVRRGTPLISWNASKLASAGERNIVTLTITNADDLAEVSFTEAQSVAAGDVIATVRW
ncbi:MAG: tyrosine-protein phosphatase [Olsenella sp.]|nr:tyrosine-protein phosphatase [Olsenella sp.]